MRSVITDLLCYSQTAAFFKAECIFLGNVAMRLGLDCEVEPKKRGIELNTRL